MSGPTVRSLLLVAGGLAAIATEAACGGAGQGASAAGPSVATAASPAPVGAAVAATSVAIANFAFSPAVITVKAGATVTWTNRDEDAHAVAIAGVPASRPLQNGDTYTHTFAQPGTYSYICSIHPYMHGMVVVTAG